jgi:hypothetical protein
MRLILTIAALVVMHSSFSQCATSGTITADCSHTGNLTITGTLNVNSGVTLTISGNLQVQAGGIINANGAIFDISGNLQDGYGTLNSIDGGTYNIGGDVSTGSGGSFSLLNATLSLDPGGTYTFNNGTANVISNTTITGVTSWSSNIGSTGSPAYGVTVSNSSITTSGDMSWHHANTSNSTFNIGGNLSLSSGISTFDNSTINTGTGNAGTTGTTALTMNGGGILNLNNNSQMNVRGDVTNNEWYVDNSDVVVTGDFDNGGNEVLEVSNDGTFSVGGDFDNSGSGNVSVAGDAVVTVSGDYNNSGGGSTDVDGGTFAVTGSYSGTTPTGDAGDCSSGGGGCCGSGCSVLPVTLVEFTVENNRDGALLRWSTALEIDNDYFIIEKSIDGKNFMFATKVLGRGTTYEPGRYEWKDEIASEVTYYRLSQFDFDGSHENLGVVLFNPRVELSQTINFYPNPVITSRPIFISGSGVKNISIFDLNGMLISQSEISRIASPNQPGIYLLQIVRSNNSTHTFKIRVH